MGKKYNYFDDEAETIQSAEKQERQREKIKRQYVPSQKKDVSFKGVLGTIRKFIAFLGVHILMLLKAIRKGLSNLKQKRGSIAVGILLLFITVIVMTTIIVVSVMSTTSKQNNRQTNFNQAAAKVCSQYTEKYGVANYKFMNSEYEVSGCMLTGLCVAREIDFDADGYSELLIAYNDNDKYYAEVWGFHSDEFQKLYDIDIYQSDNKNDDIWISLYSSGNEFYIAEHNPDDIEDVTIMKISGDTFKRKSAATYSASEYTYYMKDENVNDDFEQIKFAVLRENTAATIVEDTLDSIDTFSNSLDEDADVKVDSAGATSNVNSAYYSLVEEYQKDYGVGEYISNSDEHYLYGLGIVKLVDFNADGQDELMLIYRRTVNEREEDKNGNSTQVETDEYFCDIYSWNGNNAVLVHQNQGLCNTENDENLIYYILEKSDDEYKFCTNKFTSSENGKVVKGVSKIMSFDGTRFNTDQKAIYQNEWGYSTYTLDGTSLSKTKFTDKGGFTVPFFDGTSTYDSAIWTIGYVQGESRDETKMKKQLEMTQEVIEALQEQ